MSMCVAWYAANLCSPAIPCIATCVCSCRIVQPCMLYILIRYVYLHSYGSLASYTFAERSKTSLRGVSAAVCRLSQDFRQADQGREHVSRETSRTVRRLALHNHHHKPVPGTGTSTGTGVTPE